MALDKEGLNQNVDNVYRFQLMHLKRYNKKVMGPEKNRPVCNHDGERM